MSHKILVTQTSTHESSGPGPARAALNRRRDRLRAAGVKHTVDNLTLKFIDFDGSQVTLEYRDGVE